MPNELSNIILEHIGDGVLSVDASLNVVFINQIACDILRIDKEIALGHPVSSIMHLVEYGEYGARGDLHPFSVAMASGVMGTYSNPMLVTSVREDSVYIEDTVSPIKNADGEVIGAVMVFRDVSEEVRMLQQLKDSNQRYSLLFNSIRSGVAVYETVDGDLFKVVDFNLAAEKMEGVSKQNVIGQNLQNVFPGSEAFGIVDAIKRVWKTGQPERLPCTMYEDAFRKGWRDNYIYKLPSGEVVAVYDDVTHKKEAAERISDNIGKLRKNEKRLKEMVENSSIGVVFSGDPPHYPITQVNQAFCNFMECSMDELIGKNIVDITHPDDVEASLKNIANARSLPPSSKPVSMMKRYVKKTGGIIWGLVYLSKVEHDDGRIEHFAQIVDITDKKRSEEEKGMLASIMSELNAAEVKNKDMIRSIMLRIKKFASLDAVAVRLPERIESHDLNDYPFYFHEGFDSQFVAEERSLCCRDSNGNPIVSPDGHLDCVCGAIITGNIDKSLPVFTKGGSFWTSHSSGLIESIGLKALRIRNPRGTCWRCGYESVAVIPITSGEKMVGSMLLNAKRKGVFDTRLVEFLESVGKSMGVAFWRMQLRSDIENHKKALERANGILSVEGDVARSIADGSDSSLEEVLARAGKKLNVKWLCVMLSGQGGFIGRWTDERGSSSASLIEESPFDPNDLSKIRQWVRGKTVYAGSLKNMPSELAKAAKPIEGNWMVVPVSRDSPNSPSGVVMLLAKNGKQWSIDECNAMEGLATMLCILAKAEKNRADLSRKIEETISSMKTIATPPMAGDPMLNGNDTQLFYKLLDSLSTSLRDLAVKYELLASSGMRQASDREKTDAVVLDISKEVSSSFESMAEELERLRTMMVDSKNNDVKADSVMAYLIKSMESFEVKISTAIRLLEDANASFKDGKSITIHVDSHMDDFGKQLASLQSELRSVSEVVRGMTETVDAMKKQFEPLKKLATLLSKPVAVAVGIYVVVLTIIAIIEGVKQINKYRHIEGQTTNIVSVANPSN